MGDVAAVAVSLGAAGAADAAGTAAATAAAAATGVTGAGDDATERLVGFVDRRNGVTALGLSAPSAWRLGLGATAAIAPEANDQREVEMRAESNSGQPPLATHSFARCAWLRTHTARAASTTTLHVTSLYCHPYTLHRGCAARRDMSAIHS